MVATLLTNHRLYGGDLAKVLQELVNGVVVIGGDGILVIQQELGRDTQA